ncbi:hypothetical protein [Bradyrhizobium sp.]|uniref:hypothetical protein n=1 Tax=Bradyrhizobium sp. TaxID=376 RepID=UPI003BAEBDB1
MVAETKIEKQNERDLLTEIELEGVVGATDLLGFISDCLRTMSDTSKNVISNMRA